MTLFNKLTLIFIGIVTIVAIGSSLETIHYKNQLIESQQKAMNIAFEKQDSSRHAEYDILKSIQERRFQDFSDSLSQAHKQTIDALNKASHARSKSLQAHEERNSIHLHPDSLPRF